MTAWILPLALTNRLDFAIVEKATIILAFGLAALPFANRARASVRHLLLAATFGTVFVLPLLINTVPAITIEVPVALAKRISGPASNGIPKAIVRAKSVALPATDRDHQSLVSFATLLRFVWAAGSILLLVLLAIDLRRLRALRRRGLPWPAQNNLIRSLAVTSGVRRSVDVLLHEAVSAPVTCGLWRPTILLPIDASDWQEADLRRALVHELEHVRRGDWATQLLARLVCACYWFHPLVWMAWARLRLEAERACDDAVVQCAECTDYAEQLVTLARRLSIRRPLLSLAMANRTDLSARVVALLDGTRRRGRAGYVATASVISVATVVVVMVASFRAMAAPIVAGEMARAAEPLREDAIARRLPDRRMRARDKIGPALKQVNPAPTGPRFPRLLAEDRRDVRDSTNTVQTARSVIERSIGGTASAEWTIKQSATASVSATSSGSASSSSETNGRRDAKN